jgi:hypothetical protein
MVEFLNMKSREDKEIAAIAEVYDALKELDTAAQQRVVEYVAKKLGITSPLGEGTDAFADPTVQGALTGADADRRSDAGEDALAGVSPIAKKWMQRNGLTADQLSHVFSIGGDEIDLIAKKVPGKSVRARMRSVFLLEGVAAYLAGGAPRFTHEKVKEACLHYNAYDVSNFAANLRDLAAEVSGGKESGYTLTQRGLASATEIVKQLAGASTGE